MKNLCSIINSDNTMLKMQADKAYSFVNEEFSFEKMINNHIKAFNNILK